MKIIIINFTASLLKLIIICILHQSLVVIFPLKMRSSLALFTFSLNQQINDCLLSFPIRWNSDNQNWEMQEDKQKKFRYYLVANCTTLTWLLMCRSVVGISITNPRLLKADAILVTILFRYCIVTCVCGFAVDLIILMHSDITFAGLNLIQELEID